MTDKTCTEDDCERDGTHEARPGEGDDWRPLCERHALGAFEFGADVRERSDAEVGR